MWTFITSLCHHLFDWIVATVPFDEQEFAVHNPSFYPQVLTTASLAFGEGYVSGSWTTNNLESLLTKILSNERVTTISRWLPLSTLRKLFRPIVNRQTVDKSKQVGLEHYDISPTFYKKMLGEHMVYSCAFWHGANNLDEAQIRKMDLVCRKLQLKPGDTLLDIGCGWGELANYAAARYQVYVTGLTISQEQWRYCVEHAHANCNFLLQDYRLHQGSYHKISSVGMAEHVGVQNLPTYINKIKELLKPNGLALVHTIGKQPVAVGDAWTEKYIFPGGEIPDLVAMSKVIVQSGLKLEHLDNRGPDYAKTLGAWRDNIGEVLKRNDPFARLWNYYLTSCKVTFELRHLELWQFVMSKEREEVYEMSA